MVVCVLCAVFETFAFSIVSSVCQVTCRPAKVLIRSESACVNEGMSRRLLKCGSFLWGKLAADFLDSRCDVGVIMDCASQNCFSAIATFSQWWCGLAQFHCTVGSVVAQSLLNVGYDLVLFALGFGPGWLDLYISTWLLRCLLLDAE